MARERLIEIAMDHFGRCGFEGASTRDIAAAADTAMSSITYHFGGKQGLYLACADHIAEQIRERQSGTFALFGDSTAINCEDAKERLLAIADNLAVMMIHPASAAWARIIVREQQDPTEAFERLWLGVMQPMLSGVEKLLSCLRPGDDARSLRALAILMFGQAMVMRAGRACVCRALGVDALGPDEAELLRSQMRASTLAILNAENDQ